MTIKNIFKIHFLFYLVAFVCFITANFKNFIIFSSIILVHELGHIIGAIIFKWKIDKVILLPFGGITIFQENIDKSLKEEFIITILGPLFQLLFYYMYRGNEIFDYYNIIILIFNLLPIYPLDGSKIVNILFNTFIPFKKSHILTIICSIITITFILFFKHNLLLYLILFFIFLEIIKEIKKHNYYFNRFLLEKYLNNNKYKRKKTINKITKMYKQTNHFFYLNNKYYTEKQIMAYLFDK